MRYVFLLAFLFLIAACTQTPSPRTLSAGCQNINDAFYDSAYRSGNVYFSPFKAGESVSVALSQPDGATKLWLVVTDTSVEPRRDLAVWTATSSATLSYRFDRDLSEAEVYWSADTGVPSWSVGCHSAHTASGAR